MRWRRRLPFARDTGSPTRSSSTGLAGRSACGSATSTDVLRAVDQGQLRPERPQVLAGVEAVDDGEVCAREKTLPLEASEAGSSPSASRAMSPLQIPKGMARRRRSSPRAPRRAAKGRRRGRAWGGTRRGGVRGRRVRAACAGGSATDARQHFVLEAFGRRVHPRALGVVREEENPEAMRPRRVSRSCIAANSGIRYGAGMFVISATCCPPGSRRSARTRSGGSSGRLSASTSSAIVEYGGRELPLRSPANSIRLSIP